MVLGINNHLLSYHKPRIPASQAAFRDKKGSARNFLAYKDTDPREDRYLHTLTWNIFVMSCGQDMTTGGLTN
jgi:hypothetical protein